MTRWLIGPLALLVLGTHPDAVREPRANIFEVLAPSIVLTAGDTARLDANQVLVRTASGHDGQVAVFVATRLNATPDALVLWARGLDELTRNRFVLAVGRFSDPPQPSDLDALTLDDDDLDAIRRCRPGDCGLKLSAAEIDSLSRVARNGGDRWRDAVQGEFRRRLVERVRQYRAGGLAALAPSADRRKPSRAADTLSAIARESPFLERIPNLAEWVAQYPASDPGVESFVYWSREYYGHGKPIVSLTHVGILRFSSDARLPYVLVASKQISATHYIEGGLGLTMVFRDATTGHAYLAYVNRSQVDLLRGFLGSILCGRFENQLRRQAPVIIGALRNQLERTNAPGVPVRGK